MLSHCLKLFVQYRRQSKYTLQYKMCIIYAYYNEWFANILVVRSSCRARTYTGSCLNTVDILLIQGSATFDTRVVGTHGKNSSVNSILNIIAGLSPANNPSKRPQTLRDKNNGVSSSRYTPQYRSIIYAYERAYTNKLTQ